VLIDCPPSLGLLSLNAMTAASGVIVTMQTEYFAMRGLGQLDEIVGMVREHVNPELSILGILPTLVNPVTRLAREVLEEITAHYGELVFTTRIRQNVRLAEAPGHQMHIFGYDALSPGAADYRALAIEVEARVAALAIPKVDEAAPAVETPPAAEANGEPSVPAAELPTDESPTDELPTDPVPLPAAAPEERTEEPPAPSEPISE